LPSGWTARAWTWSSEPMAVVIVPPEPKAGSSEPFDS
jgi:hypothetical protein